LGKSDAASSEVVAEWVRQLQATFRRLAPEEATPGGLWGRSLSMGSLAMGPRCKYNPIFFGNYLSIRDEWRAIKSILDQLIFVETELTDDELLYELVKLLDNEFDLRGHLRIRQILRTSFLARNLVPPYMNLYDDIC
jgi:hypothetical protein